MSVGAKKGCDHGQRGPYAVLLDGRRVDSCLVFANAVWPATGVRQRDPTIRPDRLLAPTAGAS